jgi:hypothetical protein
MRTRIFSLPLLAVFLFTGLAWAEESGESKSKFKIKPMVSAATRYESNYFLTEDNERGMFTYFVAPGVGITYETPKLVVNFDLTVEALAYSDDGDPPPGAQKGSDLNYIAPLVALNTKYDLTERLTIGLDESFYITRYPYYYDRLSNSTDRRKYWINRLSPMISYEFDDRFEFDFRYHWQVVNYTASDYQDSTENKFFVDLLYNPQRTLTFGVDYQYWIIDYSDNPLNPSNTKTHQFWLMGQKRYKYFSFAGAAGYSNRSYQDTTERFFQPDGSKDAFVYRASVTAENPPPPDVKRPIGTAPERAKSHIYVAAERNQNSLGDSFIANRFTLSAGHVWVGKIIAVVRGYYQIADYDYLSGPTTPDPAGPRALRDDDFYNISGRIGYLITKDMEISITVGKENRNSNLAGLDYDDKFAYLRFSFGFDMGSRGGFSEEAVYY